LLLTKLSYCLHTWQIYFGKITVFDDKWGIYPLLLQTKISIDVAVFKSGPFRLPPVSWWFSGVGEGRSLYSLISGPYSSVCDIVCDITMHYHRPTLTSVPTLALFTFFQYHSRKYFKCTSVDFLSISWLSMHGHITSAVSTTSLSSFIFWTTSGNVHGICGTE